MVPDSRQNQVQKTPGRSRKPRREYRGETHGLTERAWRTGRGGARRLGWVRAGADGGRNCAGIREASGEYGKHRGWGC